MTEQDLVRFYDELRDRLSGPLPGASAQSELALVSKDSFSRAPDDARTAAVAAILYPGSDGIRLLLVERSVHEKDKHSGQISFPGGAVEVYDETTMHTAMRETQEEIAINLNEMQCLGALTSMYIPVSNYLVYPYVFGLTLQPDVIKQEEEVAEIFGYAVHRLLKATVHYRPMKHRLGYMPKVPYFDLDGRMLWGATGMMTKELIDVIDQMDVSPLSS